jgi:hypothetical protein
LKFLQIFLLKFRQLPLLFSRVQKLLKLRGRQADALDSYSALLHAVNVVSTAGKCVFSNSEAFETFLELFFNSIVSFGSLLEKFSFSNFHLTFLGQNEPLTSMGINFGASGHSAT